MKRILALSLLLTMMTGCMSFSDRGMRPVRNSISEQMPEIRLEKQMAIKLGGGIFDLIDIVSHDDNNLSEIDHVEMAVYEVLPRGSETNFSDAVFQQSLRAKNDSLSWERIVKVNDDGEQVWVFVGMDLRRQSLEAVSVFVIDNDELLLINVNGDFNQLLDYAFEPARGNRGAYHSG